MLELDANINTEIHIRYIVVIIKLNKRLVIRVPLSAWRVPQGHIFEWRQGPVILHTLREIWIGDERSAEGRQIRMTGRESLFG
jgi:hypothetical protein